MTRSGLFGLYGGIIDTSPISNSQIEFDVIYSGTTFKYVINLETVSKGSGTFYYPGAGEYALIAYKNE